MIYFERTTVCGIAAPEYAIAPNCLACDNAGSHGALWRGEACRGKARQGKAWAVNGRQGQSSGCPFSLEKGFSMGMAIRMNVAAFKEGLRAKVDVLHAATRPAAQAGAEVIYQRARINAPVSDEMHYFHIRGKKYGPYAPGNLRDSVYQVFSKSNSYTDVSTYHISWNKDKAPYGYVYEWGNSKRGAKSFIARSVIETRAQVREAIKARYIEEVNK